MNYMKEHHMEQSKALFFKALMSLNGKEIFEKYRLRKNVFTETINFEGTDYEMDIKLTLPTEENDSPWAEAVLFCKGIEVSCSEVEDNVFRMWCLRDPNDQDKDRLFVATLC